MPLDAEIKTLHKIINYGLTILRGPTNTQYPVFWWFILVYLLLHSFYCVCVPCFVSVGAMSSPSSSSASNDGTTTSSPAAAVQHEKRRKYKQPEWTVFYTPCPPDENPKCHKRSRYSLKAFLFPRASRSFWQIPWSARKLHSLISRSQFDRWPIL